MSATHCIALMYHTIYADEEEYQALLDEEKPYAVSARTFELHLQLLRQWHCPILDPTTLRASSNAWQPGVIITFDDGHRSHVTHALPILQKYQAKALFFITTACIDQPRFCSNSDLQTLQVQGMLVHAHGHSHAFFADMSQATAEYELKTSFERLSIINPPHSSPWSMSFPGGRYTPRDFALARAQGFSHVFTSDIGAISQPAFQGQVPIPRFAIKSTSTTESFKAMALPTTKSLRQAKILATIKALIKRLLGNRLYHWIYTLKAGRKTQ